MQLEALWKVMKIGVLLWEQTEGSEAEMGARNKWPYTNGFCSCSTFGLLFHCAYQRRCGRPFEPSLDLGPGQHTLAFTRSIKQGAGGKSTKYLQLLAESRCCWHNY